MKPEDLITREMVDAAVTAWDGEPDLGPFTPMRAALIAIVPMLDEEFAKMAGSSPTRVIAESVGTYTMDDGREIKGAIVSFPEGTPPFTLSVVWNREVLYLSRTPSDQ